MYNNNCSTSLQEMEVSNMLTDQVGQTSKKNAPKSVSFELLLDDKSKTRARIPLRVLVNTHDSTESIVTTVKNFYGIYDGNGVSFEDAAGNTLIASYENLDHNTTVYVRSVAGPPQASIPYPHGVYALENAHETQRRPSLGEPFQMMPPHLREHSHSPTRPSSRLAFKRSISPQHGRGKRSASQQKNGAHVDSRGSSTAGSVHDDNGYSDSEAGRSSISGSRKARSEQFASSDISTANVLQDGRRGQPIFDSSALPLFAPPQVPVTASQSSISPQRRSLPHEGPSPFQLPAQKLQDIAAPPMLSPRSYGYNGAMNNLNGNMNGYTTPVPHHNHRLRDRTSLYSSAGHPGRVGYGNNGILPTPDPTVASCISDEDVARTLIALGDASNFSHGRTSNSTVDDTFSRAADAASSTGATSDSDEYSESEGGLPKHRKYLDEEEEEEEDEDYENDALIKSEFDEYDGPPKTKKIKTKMHDGPNDNWKVPSIGLKSTKSSKIRSNTFPKSAKSTGHQSLTKTVTAPAAPGQPRKGSAGSSSAQPLGIDEEDLSSKPRCQRCRKSKKGCDRQRPCGRCRDAGIGIEGCVSEDEGNGRKGRYGRHMGVSVKKTVDGHDHDVEPQQAQFTEILTAPGSPEKSKKRKR